MEQKIKAVIFDLDGTLLDSLWIWEKIDIDFLAKRGIDVPLDYGKACSTKSFYETAIYTIERFELLDTPEEIMAEWVSMAADEYAHNVKLKPMAYEFLLEVKNKGLKIAAATSLSRELHIPALMNNNVYSFFETTTCTDDVSKSKDNPEIYLHTAKKLGVLPEECVMIDDIATALQGAAKAGMKTIGIFERLSRQDINEMEKSSDLFIFDFTEIDVDRLIEGKLV